jgi:hypothetical protein
MLALTILAAVLFTACASTPTPVPQNLKAETDDLGMVADWALSMAADHGTENILVVFDIDNTLLAMEQGLGSDQWYYWQKDLAADDPCNPMQVGNRFAVQGAMFHESAMRATQADAAEQVRRIQDAGITTIALTSRGTDYRLQTFRELRRQDISFWASAIPPQRGWPGDFLPDNGLRPVRYEDGVFLTTGQHKGAMLQALLDKAGVAWPAVIVVADDKQENLDAVMETFTGSGSWVHAWRYTREDAAVKAFRADPLEAAVQWDALRPALETIETVLGADNFSLPDATEIPGCEKP